MMLPMADRTEMETCLGDVLVISNGHGEDLNGGLVCDAFLALAPGHSVGALPIVGGGRAYRRRGLPLLVQGVDLPSGGMVYQGFNLFRDLIAGWIPQTLAQIRAARSQGPRYRLVLSIGDHVPLLFAWLTGRPTVVFLVSTSSYYEGKLRLPQLTRWLCSRPEVLHVLTRDAFTARDLQSQGLAKARFVGYPVMDALQSREGQEPLEGLSCDAALNAISIVLLPGSRLPEAQANLALMVQVCERIVQLAPEQPWSFEAAVVPGTTGPGLVQEIEAMGWRANNHHLVKGKARISISADAFAETLQRARLVLGMAGTAVEQAVGLGKPVVQLVGRGPQFTYAFAEAQMRLLGQAVFTVGRQPAGSREIDSSAELILQMLADPHLPAICQSCGLERVGPPGGSRAIAQVLLEHLDANG